MNQIIANPKTTSENASHVESSCTTGSSPPDKTLLVTLGIGLADAQDALWRPWRLKQARATLAACQELILAELDREGSA